MTATTGEAQQLRGLAAIPIDQLHASPENPRTFLTDLEGLAQSIRENGLIQPVVVQKVPGEHGYRIVAGHRRTAAARKLGWPRVPCIIRRDMLPDEELLAMLVENGQRANLDPIEEARALKKLRDVGLSQADIARRVGLSTQTVGSRLALLLLPAEEQDAIRAGHLSMARALGEQVAERQQQRLKKTGRPVGRPKGAKTTPYFSAKHPLARTATAICDHRGRPKVGGIACGECWETAIRADAQEATR